MTDHTGTPCANCAHEITGEFFPGTSGLICADCLRQNYVYYALRSLGLLRSADAAEPHKTA